MARVAAVQPAILAAIALILASTTSPGAAPRDAAPRQDDGEPPLTFGADLRVRRDVTWQPFFGLRDVPFDAPTMVRALGHLDLRLSDRARTFLELASMWALGRSLPERSIDENRFDLQQGFAELDLIRPVSRQDSRLTLRGGRQTVSLGSSRLVGVRDGTNVRRAFDGMRLLFESTPFDAQLLALASPELRRGILDDAPALNELLFGGYTTVRPLGELSVDAYYLGYRAVRADWFDATGRELRHSLGARVFGKAGLFDYNDEAVLQLGSVGESRIAAWTVATDHGVAMPAMGEFDVRIALRANVASGDGTRNDGTLGTFSPLFPRLPYFSELALISPSNVVDLHPLVTVTAFESVSLQLDVDVFFRHRTSDGIYTSPNSPLVLPRGDRYSGTQLNARLQVDVPGDQSLTLYASYFDVSASLAAAGARDAGSLGFWYQWSL